MSHVPGPAAVRAPVAHSSRAAAAAVGSLFAMNGTVVGAYVGVLPALRVRLGVEAGTLAVLLFCAGAAAVVSMQVGGRLADRVGGRVVVLTTMPLMVAGAAVLGLATSFPLAVVGAVLIGFGNGGMDVAMNTLAVVVEQARSVPVMSRFHAFWSIGSFVGAGVVLVTAALTGGAEGSVVAPAMFTVAGLSLLALVVVARRVPETERVVPAADGVRAPIPAVAWLLGAMAVCFGLMEGTAYDWSSLHVTDVAGVDPGIGSVAVVTVTFSWWGCGWSATRPWPASGTAPSCRWAHSWPRSATR